MAKEPINTSNNAPAAPSNTFNRTPSVPPRSSVNISAIDKSTLKPVLPNRFSGGENVSTKDGKFNMAQLQKFEYFSKENIVPNKTLRNSEDWKSYKDFLDMDKTEKDNICKEYGSWKKEQEEMQASQTGEQTHEENTPPEEQKTLSPEDQYEALKNQAKYGILTPDDQKKLEVMEKTFNKNKTNDDDDNVPTVESDNEDKHTPEKEKSGPFQEGDIIDYMYKEWLIGGANHLYIKADKYSRKYGNEMYDSFINKLKKDKRDRESKKDAKPTETRTFEANVDEKLGENFEKKCKKVDENKDTLVKRLQLISEGKYDEAEVSPELRAQLEKAGSKHVEKFCNDSIANLENMAQNYKMIQNIASTLTSAEVNMEKVNNAKKSEPSKKTLSKRQDEISKAIVAKMSSVSKEGGDPVEFINNLYAQALKAQAFTHEQIEQDNTNEFKKPAVENKLLQACLKDIKKDDDKKEEPNTMIEALEGNLNIDKNLSDSLEKINRERSGLKYRSEDLEKRRERIKKLEKKFDRKESVLDLTRHSDGSRKTSSVVLVDRLAESERNDKASGSNKQSKDTQNIVQELNKNNPNRSRT